jgi:glutamate-ammonia-ligase adenylyltransferase
MVAVSDSMEALTDSFIAGLDRGEADPQLLATVGDEEPGRAAEAFLAGARDADLGQNKRLWVPALLRSARPGFGARCLRDLSERERAAGSPLDLRCTPTVASVLGASNALARLLLANPGWAAELAGDPPAAPATNPLEPDWREIRCAKYRGLLRIAARDLAGRRFRDSLRELSDLADRCLAAGLACAARETGHPPPALLALGKLGGRELNFSSDVDLLFVYAAAPERNELQQNQDATAVIRRFKTQLEAHSVDGFGYRVDLDLRPEGKTGVLANSVDAALGYYEAFGAEWERQMLIRLRGLAGPEAPREAFASGVVPFVYRRLIDPGVMHAVRDMKARIENERRDAGRDIEADLKEGPGGIRDVEFIVQSLQLFFGGRHPELRTGNVLDSLAVLCALGLLPEAVTSSLADAYLWLRRAEHALQLAEEQQTAAFPRGPGAQLALARRMGYDDERGSSARDRLLEDWTAVRNETRTHFDALVLSEGE